MIQIAKAVKGKQDAPYRIVLYSPEGCGKSTFGSQAPSPIFLTTEDGTGHLDAVRVPFDEAGRTLPKTWQEIVEAVAALAEQPHDFQTLVLDTLDAAEPLLFKKVCEDAKAPNIEAAFGGYGKGYVAALDQWRLLLAALDGLRTKRGMNIVLLAHSTVKNFKSPDPSIEPFDRYELKLNGKASSLIKEWPDAVLFANYEILTTDKNGKTRGISTGARIMRTSHTAAWDAKNRYALPEAIPLSWAEFDKAAKEGRSTAQGGIVAEIRALEDKLPEGVRKDVPDAIKRAGNDINKLNTVLNWAKSKIAA
jgi:hypothetical protein